MSWFTAHIVMVVKLKKKSQARFPVWENIVLLEADTEEEAFGKAERIGHDGEGDDDGSFRWGGHAARWEFAGVRKLTECITLEDRPGDGTEVSFNELELDSQEAVDLLAKGEPAPAIFKDRFRAQDETQPAKARKAKQA